MIARADGTEPRLSPVFGDPAQKFTFLINAEGRPADVASERGILSCDDPPAIWYALNHKCCSPTAARQHNLVASTDDEVHVFDALGFNCLPAAGLDQLSSKHYLKLYQRGTHKLRNNCHLTLCCWQIADLTNEPSPLMQRVLQRFNMLEEVRPYQLEALFNTWQLRDDEFSRLRSGHLR